MQIIRIDECELCGGMSRLVKVQVSESTFYVCGDCVADLISAPFPCVQKLTAKEDN